MPQQSPTSSPLAPRGAHASASPSAPRHSLFTIPHSPCRRAFTLFELVLILAIIAVTVGVAIPSLGGFVRHRELADTVTRFIATTRYARTQAISQGVVYRLNLDASQGHWSLSKADETGINFSAADPSGESDYTLPAKIQMSCDLPLQDGQQHIEFQPTGKCDTALVTFNGPNGAVRQVVCDSPFENYYAKAGGQP